MQIDEHIDFVVQDAFGNLSVRHAVYRQQMIKGFFQARTMRRTVFGTGVVGVQLESFPVNGFQ